MNVLVYILSAILLFLAILHTSGNADITLAIPLVTLSAFIYVIEDFFDGKPKIKQSLNVIATILLFIALIARYLYGLQDSVVFTFIKNNNDFLTVVSVAFVIIFKTITANKINNISKEIAKLEQIQNRLEKVYSVSEIQNELKIGEKAYVFDKGNVFEDHIITRREDRVIFWSSFGMGNAPLNPNGKTEKDLNFKILL
ncbi:hypothetical protein CN984_20330 [Bacillus cereus]|uniref:Uncharacterized protein n=1 Tax=Bacillus cereus TaxID=1396 RepID=A0A2B9PQP9_BACCE|nr:hypothetical protein [Bacillus cereus]PGO24575.1 hypothetical protein CN984_20330 [Bacillus cereus]